MTFKTHYFDSIEEAYDKTQTGYYRSSTEFVEVADGDLLVVPKKGVYGFLYGSWPVAYYPDLKEWQRLDENLEELPTGAFHTLNDEKSFLNKYPEYVEVYEAAKQLYELHHLAEASRD